jgi:hypothetical protein
MEALRRGTRGRGFADIGVGLVSLFALGAILSWVYGRKAKNSGRRLDVRPSEHNPVHPSQALVELQDFNGAEGGA